jgi:hypothetical protein
MSNFRTKLLGLIAFATLFTGASFGQAITACAPNTTGAVIPGPTNMRAEGTTELAGNIVFHCSSTVLAASTTSISVFTSAPVTSQPLSAAAITAANTAIPGSAPTGATEAALFICADAAPNTAAACTSATGGAQGPYFGLVSATGVTFTGISLNTALGGFSGVVYDVRMNANAVTLGTTLTTVTETVLATTNNTSGATTPITSGFVFQSLAAPAFATNPNGANTASVVNYTACAGNIAKTGTNLTAPAFAPIVSETFGGAFKTAAGEEGVYDPGATVGTLGTPGSVSFGTRIQFVITNVPAGLTVYAPTTVTFTGVGAGNTLTLTETASVAGPLSPVAATATATNGQPLAGASSATVLSNYPVGSVAWGASAAQTATNGTVTVVYEVTAAAAAYIQSTPVPFWLGAAPNAVTTAPQQLSVLESYAPTAAAGSATTIPNFAPPTNTALLATNISLCQTTLLFPYLANTSGFDVGIALSNTSMDPFKTVPVNGACTLNFYGTGAPTPSTGVAAPGGTQAAGTTNAFLLSSVAPGFQGYMIADCQYTDGHGFAYIIDAFGTSASTAMGYVALQLERAGLGSPETLGQ